MYALIRALLFRLDAENSHNVTMNLLALISRSPLLLRLLNKSNRTPVLRCRVMGLDFINPVGLAAGLDKDARVFPALAAMGFGWVELGTVTPRPQRGNPGKRLFRLVEDHALVNRMGFNSAGLKPFIESARRLRRHTSVPIGINIGKNADTPIADADQDYVAALDAVYALADYVAINVSSPNTRSLRQLQQAEALDRLLRTLVERRWELATRYGKTVPLALKIAPDLDADEICAIGELVLAHQIDIVIATNTTRTRSSQLKSPLAVQEGGLSGPPLLLPSTTVVSGLHRQLAGKVPIIGVGGIESSDDALYKIKAGADLLQIYTGFIYRGPGLIREIVDGLTPHLPGPPGQDNASAISALHRQDNGER